MAFTFEQARACVLLETGARRAIPATETVALLDASGRILAENVSADRDYPPFPRSARDGFAVRAADLPGTLRLIGEVRAGEVYSGSVGPGETVEIMTGAPMPAGTDAVVMVEHVVRDGNCIQMQHTLASGDNFNAQGLAAQAGVTILFPGQRLGYADIAMLASVGRDSVQVYRKPRVAVVPTGDEIVEGGQQPATYQIRNSNAWSMAVQVTRAGGEPVVLPVARDNYASTVARIEEGLQCDMLLLSGGVSAGKYDIVEKVLADLGAEFFFTRVLIQPGQPLVFGVVKNDHKQTLFFGLPGNPGSTMVTFEVFARAAVELLSGANEAPLHMLQTRLWKDLRQKTGLTRFIPSRLSDDGATVEQVGWHGSGDVSGMTRANAFIVTEPNREQWSAGEMVRVLMK
ncbi:MAG: gephyrin-like molybdotransferase Glp [Acidobacteriota bacterium]